MIVDTLEYNGKQYMRYKSNWVDSNNMVVHLELQDILNNLFIERIDLSGTEIQEIIMQASKFKESGSYKLAIKYYEYVIENSTENAIRFVLPQITSCYRKYNEPQKAIDTVSLLKQKYGGGILTHSLLTSLAAAYCDMEEFGKAKKCCDRAYAMNNGSSSLELAMVYKRIDASQK